MLSPETEPELGIGQDREKENRERALYVLGVIASAAQGARVADTGSTDPETMAFINLRTATYDQMQSDIEARLATNPTPTTQERNMGTYVEGLEPQVRSAVMTMREKGYNTVASGFNDNDYDWRVVGMNNPDARYDPANRRDQVMYIRGDLSFSAETLQQLTEMGAEIPEVTDGGSTVIGFRPETADLREIEAQWNAIASLMPDLGEPAGPRMGTLDATQFGIYCPPDISWPMEQFNAAIPPMPGPEAPPAGPVA